MSDQLARLKRAESARRRSETGYRAALRAAVDTEGPTRAGAAIGWTRQRVQSQLTRWAAAESLRPEHRRKEQER